MDHAEMPLTRDHEALGYLCGPSGLLSAKEVAYATGLHANYVYEFLNGRRNPTPQMFNQILRYAGRFIAANLERYIAIANVVVPLVLDGTPIEPRLALACPLEGKPIADVAREAAALCEASGTVLRNLGEIFADGRIDHHDDPNIVALKGKATQLQARLDAILGYIDRRRTADGRQVPV